ncbi:unnamed protein product [Medioppia subpectinata]|uniref:Lipase domain-containing protein n=1 Tax=Medioppia subpectinata TaxID=1979941 RepID=A0A7R9Q1C1_9ACAR|nr:unnamed protein product [Medioppia subpectinata]CAG2108141.1 unnamed protein product [Medioppia subpectinata]
MTTLNSPTAIITKLAIIITAGNLFTHVWGQEVSGVCYGELGCFNRTHDYQHAIIRPVALLPQSPQHINTKLSFYTRQRPEGRHLLLDQWLAGGKDLKAFVDLSTDDRKPLKFIVIGFNDNPINQQWINRLKNELIINSDCNVFIVDWSKGNGLPYHQSIENMRVVAAQLYVFIINLWGYLHVDFNDYHIIGYSVGAHLAGLVGKQVKSYNASSALGRITGLERN